MYVCWGTHRLATPWVWVKGGGGLQPLKWLYTPRGRVLARSHHHAVVIRWFLHKCVCVWPVFQKNTCRTHVEVWAVLQ